MSWFISQFLKIFQRMKGRKKRFNFRWLFNTGGMPSSHSATMASLATVVGLYYGFQSILFLMALILAFITMFDAASVRRNVGRQAILLNKIVDEFYERGQVPEKRLKELLGHTPVEVFAGAFLGIFVAILLCRL